MVASPLLAARPERLVMPFVSGGAMQAAFEPSLALSSAVAVWLNDAASRRAAWQARLGDRALSVRIERLSWQDEPAATAMLDFIWDAGGEDIVLSLPRPLAEALVSAVQSGLALPSEPSRSLVLELALEPLLVKLEAQTHRTLRLVSVNEAAAKAPYLELDIAYGQIRGRGRLVLFSPLDGPVPSFFLALGALLGQLPPQKRELPVDFPIIAAGEVGSLRLPAKILRGARAGDVLLPDDAPLARGQVTLAVGKLWAAAELAGERLHLRGRFRPRPSPLEHAHMTAPTEPTQPPAEADLDDVEVTLVFECGRWPITLGALRTLGEGHVFELGRPVDGPVDILANGRRVGRGDIVRVGDVLGVRLHGRLAGNA